jgi:hypothetical protein
MSRQGDQWLAQDPGALVPGSGLITEVLLEAPVITRILRNVAERVLRTRWTPTQACPRDQAPTSVRLSHPHERHRKR